ncbi:UDP-glucose 4-epimerase GalE [Aquibium microcysteis]|uniref:UDP-glucose 4-epimerase GalE n=1 Tax=Aquibium microcysteis TaxID=675281 RepID=UPI00165D1CC4|nr:UDP-glucose 4-epimerase GalE [Aquibium microcysteis]
MNGGDRGRVLVTGGAGYIGAHACKALARAGYLPVAFDDLSQGHVAAVRWGPLERGDILDRGRLDEVMSRYGPSAVLHFAAVADVAESVADPGRYHRINAAGSLNLLEAARDHGVGRFVLSSTCATYGTPDRLPIDEDMPQRPINPYGASKLSAERMTADFCAAHGMRAFALRYFNAAGADPDGEIGEDHAPETHLIPLLLAAAAGGADLRINGMDFDTPDGTCIRDYVHVSDLAAAHVAALMRLEEGHPGGALNLGRGEGASILEVVRAVERITGTRVPFVVGPRRAGDPAALVSDASRARVALGWKPEFPDLDEIVRTAWAWHRRAAAPAGAG